MPHTFFGRILIILTVLVAVLWGIFPQPTKLLDSSVPWSQKHNLKPGIDMVGGTSLTYDIKPVEGAGYSGNLAQQMMESLKRRVDPQGVMNLVWRPQGERRLEIQMPFDKRSSEAQEYRKEYAAAQDNLEETNIRPSAVSRAIRNLKGDERRREFDKLANESETRATLLGTLAMLHDQIEQAKTAQDADAQAKAEIEYDKQFAKITDTNLTTEELEAVLSQSKAVRDPLLTNLRTKFADYPKRLTSIDQFVSAYDKFSGVRGSIEDATDLKHLLRGSGVLEFHILVTQLESPDAIAMVQRLRDKGPALQANDTMRWYVVENPKELGRLTFPYGDKQYALAYISPNESMTNTSGGPRWALQGASRQQSDGRDAVGFLFDTEGAIRFGHLTSEHEDRPLAIMLDDVIISAPNINSPITGGSGVIEGGSDGFTQAELSYLIKTLNAGSLPAQLEDEPISERTVGPQLGQDNLERGFYSCLFGLVVVAVFLIGYYYTAGVVAFFAVLMNMVMILGGMAMLDATFTLPGIAGIVLTIGMAVDANVLIFERLREEQVRGLSLPMALRNAYQRAFSAILDSNITTGITAGLLAMYGSEEVKGFGITLLIGLVSSLFTSLFVTKTIFGILISKFGLTKLGSFPLTFPKWDRALRPNIDWMGKAWIFCTFSTIFIVLGLGVFGYKLATGKMLDIEFATGTSVQFELKTATPIDEVRKLITSAASDEVLPSPSVVSVGTDQLIYEVVTPNERAADVKEAVLKAMGDRLKLELPSHFERENASLEMAMEDVVFPIEETTTRIGDFALTDLDLHIGGVAVVLKNIDPPLSPEAIEARIERQRLQSHSGDQAGRYRKVSVVSNAANSSDPVSTAVVLASDDSFPYSQDQVKWRDELARPVWQLINDSVARPAELQKVNNFNAQVAGKTKRDALVAMTLSILAIMAYIWARFGNLKYGTATVVALLHDTLFAMGAIGLAHLIAETPIGAALLIEPFRINLTMVAAILTIMGYSMNDTVVVFDRIRENRGKFGHVSRQVINDSINQTLSRTLLTGGTTIVTIFVMYVAGGAGIHGFTFALLVGILVGTYSSIAIASPILLLGRSGQLAGTQRNKTPVSGQLQQA